MEYTLSKERWGRLWQALGALAPDGSFEFLQEHYNGHGRHYHTQAHIAACLAHLDQWRHLAAEPQLVELALWLHDVIYDTRRADNEARSADIAVQLLTQVGLAKHTDSVATMIMATTHKMTAGANDCGLVLDLDLAVLAQPRWQYNLYSEAVQREYSWVPVPAFRAGRAKVLRQLLNCHPLYGHPEIAAVFELTARENLQSELSDLESQIGTEP
ncbi:TPA: hypothetical protein ACP32N_005062 [Pseudomonas aeruginosa]